MRKREGDRRRLLILSRRCAECIGQGLEFCVSQVLDDEIFVGFWNCSDHERRLNGVLLGNGDGHHSWPWTG